ncbi:MAG: glutathione peroxidase [Pseudomonas fluorescens]|nr:MAG: glutathione peroxidase [Pseudomonas fluorescens]
MKFNVFWVFLTPLTGTLYADATPKTAWDFSFHKLHGRGAPLELSKFKGQVLLVINTASNCGFTPQFADLETLYQKYKEQGFTIVGVPSNNFGSQEPDTETDIEQVCRYNYGVTFPMAQKENVIGKQAHSFYKWVPAQLGLGSAPKWNFHKYLIGRDGKPVKFYLSTTSPLSSKLTEAIETELAKPIPNQH